MDLEQLERLMALMTENDLTEVEIEDEQQRIRLKKAGADAVVMAAPAPVAAAPGAPVAASAAPLDDSSKVEGNSLTFNSPMVGTFYSSSSPGAEPFVSVGKKVGANTVLCIIEAMKVMNEITADMEGEVTEVLVSNGEAVEYGQALFTIKPR